METHRSVVEGAVTAMLPRTNLQKAAVSEAIGEAAGLLEDDESIVRLYGGRTLPGRMRGAGLVLITDRAVISVDCHPSDGTRCHRIPINELRSVSIIPVHGGQYAGIAAIGEHDRVEFMVGPRAKAEEFVEQLRGAAPDAVEANPAKVVPNWWEDPQIAWPPKLSLGNRWEYIGGLPEFPRTKTGLRMDLSRAGIVAGTVERNRIALPWERVRTIHVEGARQVEGRITVSRLLAVGFFAVAWKKKLNSGFLVANLNDGGEVIFASARHTEPRLRGALSSVLAAAPSDNTEQESPSSPSLSARLRELAHLRDEGLVTPDEFESKKAQMLEEF
jgi:hypothetical protein